MLRHSSAREESDERWTGTWMGIIALERENWEWSGSKAHDLQDRVQFDLRSAVGKPAPLKTKGAANSNVRLPLRAQPVDATPCNQLLRQYFSWRTDLFGCTRSTPNQGSVPADPT